MPPLALADEFMLVTHLDAIGSPATRMSGVDYGLCGAVLCDLALTDRLLLTTDGLLACGSPHSDDPTADLVVRRLRTSRRPHRAAWWIRTLHADVRNSVLSHLLTAGVLRPATGRLSPMLRLSRKYTLADVTITSAIVERVGRVVSGEEPDADGRTAALLQMVDACGGPRSAVSRHDAISRATSVNWEVSVNDARVRELADAVRQNVAVAVLAGWT